MKLARKVRVHVCHEKGSGSLMTVLCKENTKTCDICKLLPTFPNFKAKDMIPVEPSIINRVLGSSLQSKVHLIALILRFEITNYEVPL